MKNKTVLKSLNMVDLFQHNVSLKMKSRYRISSDCGRFLSICIIIFLVYNFFSSDMIRNTNPIVLFQSFETKLRPGIKLDQDNFVLAFGITDFSNLIYPSDPTIFNFDGYQNLYNNNNWIYTNLTNNLCTQKIFDRFPNEYLKLGLSNASCINSNEANKLFVKGWWDEEEISYFFINLNKCKNQTDSSIICQSPEAIETFFKNKFFSFWVEQKNIDMKNYENPISSKIKNFYRLIRTNEYRETNFFLKKTFIITDDDPIYSNENFLESYQHEGLDMDSNPDASETFFSLYFYSGASTQTFQRNYQKLFNLLASLGGILGALTTIFSIIIKLIVEWKVNEIILNKLYFLSDKYNNFCQQKINLITPSKSSTYSSSVTEVNKKKKLTFSFWEWIRLLFRKKKNRTAKETLYLKYMEKMNKKLDLIEILKKLEEIEKIKYVIFNENQLSLFNTITKKYIYFSDKKDAKENIFKYHQKQNNISQLQITKIRTHFARIALRKENMDPIDRRLMRLIDLI